MENICAIIHEFRFVVHLGDEADRFVCVIQTAIFYKCGE